MEYLVPPWQHQLTAIEEATPLPEYALFFEMGAGKTSTLINILRHKFAMQDFGRGRLMRTLIFAPPIVLQNWVREWGMHSRVARQDITVLYGPGYKRVENFTKRMGGGHGHIFITNYESLLMKDLFPLLCEWRPEVLVLDESHKCKDRNTQRTKALVKLNQFTTHRYLLSGSPILNSPLDLFSQFLLLDRGETFGKNFFAFRGRYFRDMNAGMPAHMRFPNWKIIPGALDEIGKLIAKKSMRVEKKDCMDLPPLVRTEIKVPMERTQARMYEEMKRDFITYMKDEAVTAQTALVKALRLQQIASGYAMAATGSTLSLGLTPKQDALKELLEALTPNHKVLVWAVWKENYEQIRRVCESLEIPYAEVHGDIPGTQKFNNVDRFNSDPECRVFIGHPGSGGIGINLVSASYSIFYSRNFSLEQSLQAEARNHRGGSQIHDKITRIDIVCENTIDELVCKSLANKIEVSDKVLGQLVKDLEAV